MASSGDGHDPEYGTPTSPSSEFQQPTLPALTSTPTPYPGCCLALSKPLLAHIASLLPPPPHLTLSIGSGYGLLEALLLSPPYSLNATGVEVQPSPNTYLQPSNHKEVTGSRSLHELAGEAEGWMFVYPRRVGMVDEYMKTYGEGRVECVIWIGPQADWGDYEGCFEGWQVTVQSANEVGGRAWERIAVARKRL
jgi:hypothetical protein